MTVESQHVQVDLVPGITTAYHEKKVAAIESQLALIDDILQGNDVDKESLTALITSLRVMIDVETRRMTEKRSVIEREIASLLYK